MKVIKELLGLNGEVDFVFEASVPVELKAVVDAFPKHHGKAFEKLWGTSRLMWHGMTFFDGNDLGPAYMKAEKAAMLAMKELDAEECVVDGARGVEQIEFAVKFDSADVQECYLGYDPRKDKLYIGFDVWADAEEAFNEAFDKAFEAGMDEAFDHENSEHEKIFNQIFKQFKDTNYGFWGLVFEITHNDGDMIADLALTPMVGGFYKDAFKIFKNQHPNTIDLRLD